MNEEDIQEVILEYYNSQFIKKVFEILDNYKDIIISNWKDLAKIYSPSGDEINRAKYILEKFNSLGLSNLRIDSTGNVVGQIIGKNKGTTLAFIGMMDDLKTIAERVKNWDKPIIIQNEKILGPGTYTTGACVSIIGLAKLFTLPQVEFKGKIYLVGVAKEELYLEGMKGFLKEYGGEIDYIIDVMGGLGRMYYGALGITMLKIHFKGPEGHTMEGGLPNVTRGVARAIDQIYSIPLPGETKEKEVVEFGIGKIDLRGHYLNITMLHASEVVNHKAEDAWFTVDLRSINNDVITSILSQIKIIVENVAAEEKLDYEIEILTEIPAGQLDGARNSRLVRIAEESMKLFTSDLYVNNMGSSNMNIGIQYEIPSIMIAGNEGGNRDTPQEYGNIESIIKGIKLNFLIGYILTSEKWK